MSRRRGLLARIGLDRPELRAWALYDWANSAFFTVVVTAVFPIYFKQVAAAGMPDAEATARFGWATSAALILVALISPVLGAFGDYTGLRKRLLTLFLFLGAGATAAMYFIESGDWVYASVIFGLGNLGILLSITFYDSLLPHLAGDDEIDRVSTGGFALGYVGGGLLLVAALVLIMKGESFGLPGGTFPTRLSFLVVAIWWVAFSVPLMWRVPEPPPSRAPGEQGVSVLAVFRRLGETLRDLRRHPQAFLMLIAVLVYNDGITTIYRMATIFGDEIGIPRNDLITAVVLVQFVGFPFAFLFGALAGRIGTKPAILCGLTVYLGISIFGYFVQTTAQFYMLAIAVAMVQGGTQALSRSLFASLIPTSRSSQFFGFFAVAEKFSAVLGPLVFSWVTLWTGSSRYAVLSVIAFFLVGGLLLSRVRVEEGQKQALESA